INAKAPLLRREWPQHIFVPGDTQGGLFGFGAHNRFWHAVKQLRKFTDVSAEKFSKEHEGSTGWEYASMVAFVNNHFYYSNPTTSQGYQQVTSTHTLEVKTTLDSSQN